MRPEPCLCARHLSSRSPNPQPPSASCCRLPMSLGSTGSCSALRPSSQDSPLQICTFACSARGGPVHLSVSNVIPLAPTRWDPAERRAHNPSLLCVIRKLAPALNSNNCIINEHAEQPRACAGLRSAPSWSQGEPAWTHREQVQPEQPDGPSDASSGRGRAGHALHLDSSTASGTLPGHPMSRRRKRRKSCKPDTQLVGPLGSTGTPQWLFPAGRMKHVGDSPGLCPD